MVLKKVDCSQKTKKKHNGYTFVVKLHIRQNALALDQKDSQREIKFIAWQKDEYMRYWVKMSI